MDIGRSISERLAQEPEKLWVLMDLARSKVSDTCVVERETLSLASFLPQSAEAWLRFAKEARPADARDSAEPLASAYVKAQGWRLPGVLEALIEKQPDAELAIAKFWGEAWVDKTPADTQNDRLALSAKESSTMARGVINAMGSKTQLLLQGIGSSKDVNLDWIFKSDELALQLTNRYGPGGAAESWGRVVATLLDHHLDYGKTPHWAAQGVWEVLAGAGYGDDQRARELAVKGFDEKARELTQNERASALFERALSPIYTRLEALRVGGVLPAPHELPRGRGPRKA